MPFAYFSLKVSFLKTYEHFNVFNFQDLHHLDYTKEKSSNILYLKHPILCHFFGMHSVIHVI